MINERRWAELGVKHNANDMRGICVAQGEVLKTLFTETNNSLKNGLQLWKPL